MRYLTPYTVTGIDQWDDLGIKIDKTKIEQCERPSPYINIYGLRMLLEIELHDVSLLSTILHQIPMSHFYFKKL